LHSFEDDHPHGSIGDREVKPYGKGVLLWFEADDFDARYRTKRDIHWLGYVVHYTETFDRTKVSLITHVHTTPATVHDSQCTALIQAALRARHLLPRDHIVDAGYIAAELLLRSARAHKITLVGPLRISHQVGQ
jgi:transposase